MVTKLLLRIIPENFSPRRLIYEGDVFLFIPLASKALAKVSGAVRAYLFSGISFMLDIQATPTSSRYRGATRLGLNALALSILIALGTAPQGALAQDASVSISISAQSLDTALEQLGEQAGLQIFYVPETVRGLNAPAISGNLTADEALRRLLAGTGVEFRRTGKNVSLSRPASETTQLAPVTVTGSLPGALPPAYVGGQVARGGRVGMLGNKDVMDTPFSQISYTSKTIQDQQATTVNEVLANDPSVITNSKGGFDDYQYIRGFAAYGGRSLNGLTGIAPWEYATTDHIERVEVLKGPSALLNGMAVMLSGSDIGGSVNLVTKQAGDEPLTQLTARYASDSQFGAHVDMGRRFGDDKEIGIRFNGAYSGGDTALDSQWAKDGTAAINLDYRSERIRLSADLGHQSQNTNSASNILFVRNIAGKLPYIPSPPDNSTSLYPSWHRRHSKSTFGMIRGEVDITENVTAYAAIGAQKYDRHVWGINSPNLLDSSGTYNLLLLQNVRAYRDALTMQGGLNADVATGPVNHALNFNFSQTRLKSGSSAKIGASPATTGTIYDPDIPSLLIPDDPGDPIKTAETTVSSIGVADTISFLDDRVLLTAGIRHQKVESTNFDYETGAETSSYKSDAWTPAFGLVVKPWENVSLYANYIEGLQPGTTVSDMYANAGQIFSPYVSKQYEAGAKVDWGNVTTTLAVFQIAQPSTIAIPDPAGGLPTLSLNGEQRNRGVELNAYGEVLDGVRLLGGVTLLDARQTKTAGGAFDGERAAGAPKFRAVIGAEWDTPFIQGLTLTGRFTYTSNQVVVNNVPNLTIPSWTQLDLGARYTLAAPWNRKTPVTIRFNVDNVFDNNYWQGTFSAGTLNMSQPRTFRLSASIPF